MVSKVSNPNSVKVLQEGGESSEMIHPIDWLRMCTCSVAFGSGKSIPFECPAQAVLLSAAYGIPEAKGLCPP